MARVNAYLTNHLVPHHLHESITNYYEYKMVTSKKVEAQELIDLPTDLMVGPTG